MAQQLCDADFPYAQVLRVQFPAAAEAAIVFETMNVDVDLKPDRSLRTLRLEGDVLVAYVSIIWRPPEMRMDATCSLALTHNPHIVFHVSARLKSQ